MVWVDGQFGEFRRGLVHGGDWVLIADGPQSQPTLN
jgi:hypothetical protein